MAIEGQVIGRLGQTFPANHMPHLLGQMCRFINTNPRVDYRVGPQKDQIIAYALYVQNTSGGALLPKLLGQYDAAGTGTQIGGLAGAAEVPAGVIDHKLPAAGVADQRNFFLIIWGRTELTGAAALSAGDAAQAAASGQVGAVTGVGDNSRVGRLITAIGGVGQTGEAFVDIRM